MARAKPTRPQRIVPDQPTSTDTLPPIDDSAVRVELDAFAVGTPPAAEEVKTKKPKARKPKACERCDERRAREREYARASRLRAKATKPKRERSKSVVVDLTGESDAGGDRSASEAGGDAAAALPTPVAEPVVA